MFTGQIFGKPQNVFAHFTCNYFSSLKYFQSPLPSQISTYTTYSSYIFHRYFLTHQSIPEFWFRFLYPQLYPWPVSRICDDNTHVRSKRYVDPSFRYRPLFTKCRIQSECDRYHKHLFLATNSGYQDLLKECSVTIFLHDAVDLRRHLSNLPINAAIVVVHTSYHHKRLYVDIMKTMIARLGNVSLFADDRSKYHEVSDTCDALNMCTNLQSLLPVIEQTKQWNANTRALSSTILDLYDSRWLPMTALPMRSNQYYSPSNDFQLQLLAFSLCARSRRYNLFYEVAPSLVWVYFLHVHLHLSEWLPCT